MLRKVSTLLSKKYRKQVTVILLCCFIQFLILLNWQTSCQCKSFQRNFQNARLNTVFVTGSRKRDIKKFQDLINETKISSTTRLVTIITRNTTFKETPTKVDKVLDRTINTSSSFPGPTLSREDSSKITLKPNFSKMINATNIVSTLFTPYLIENPTLCSSVKNLSILIMLHTATGHFGRRALIRSTWANNIFYLAFGHVRVMFLLGKSSDIRIQERIEMESNRYGDILQGDFVDSYRNLTLKGVMAYKWLAERCQNAKFILKVDDDILVNMFILFTTILPKYALKSRQIVCNHIIENTMPIIRKNDSKWYVDERHFKGRSGYPTDYCSGFLIIFTNDMMMDFYSSAKVTPFFWVDDVYLYGLVPGNVPGVKYNAIKGSWHQLSGKVALTCFRNASRTCDYLAIGAGGKGEIEDIWPHLLKRYYLPTLV